MKLLTRTALGLALLVTSAHSASSDAFLQKLAGDWSGDGWAKRQADGPRDAVRCRLKFTSENQSERLTISGKCAGGGGSGKVAGDIKSLGGGRYRASWSGGGHRIGDMSGRQTSGGLAFRWSYADEATGGIVTGDFSLRLADDALQLKTRQSEPPSGELGMLQLRRR